MNNSIGTRLKELRTSLGLSQRAFGQLAQINQTTIGLIENGQREPSRSFIGKMYDTFHVSANWLLFGHGPMFIGDASETETNPSSRPTVAQTTEAERKDAAPKLAHEIKAKFDTAYEHEPRAPSGAFFLFTGAFCAIWLLFFRLIGVL